MARIGTRMTNHSEPPVAAAAILLALSNFLPSVRPGFKRIGRTAETLLGRTKSLVGPASRRPSASAREDGRLRSTTVGPNEQDRTEHNSGDYAFPPCHD